MTEKVVTIGKAPGQRSAQERDLATARDDRQWSRTLRYLGCALGDGAVAPEAADDGCVPGANSADVDDLLGQVLTRVPVGLFVVDRAGRVVRWNRRCESLMGCQVGGLRGQAGLERLLGPGAAAAVARAQTGHEVQVERVLTRPDGATFFGSLGLSPLYGADQTVIGCIGHLLDISARQALQEEVGRIERMAALGLQVSGIAHDFKNILGRLLLCVGTGGLPSPEENPVMGILQRAVKQGLALADTLLARAHRRLDDRVPTDLGRLTRELLDLTGGELGAHGVQVKAVLPTGVLVMTNPGLIQSVLLNLVLNAREAMPQGGVLSIDLIQEPGAAGIRVSDTGAGMSAGVLAHIFEPHFTTKSGPTGPRCGSGLGLYMASESVRRLGGRLDCESSRGRGTTFMLFLPWAGESGQAGAAPAATSGCDPTTSVSA